MNLSVLSRILKKIVIKICLTLPTEDQIQDPEDAKRHEGSIADRFFYALDQLQFVLVPVLSCMSTGTNSTGTVLIFAKYTVTHIFC